MKRRIDPKTVARLLKEERLSRNLTQQEIADNLKKPQSYISKCESGGRKIDIIEYMDLCEAMNLDPNIILNKMEKMIRRIDI